MPEPAACAPIKKVRKNADSALALSVVELKGFSR